MGSGKPVVPVTEPLSFDFDAPEFDAPEFVECDDAPEELHVTRRLPRERVTIRERFERFDAQNPEIYRLLVHYARLVRDHRGKGRYGMKALWERVRWHVEIERDDEQKFALDNNFTALYARRIMEREPDLSGFFETRRLKAK